MPKLKVLTLTGSPYEMGYQHGNAYCDGIHQFAEERLTLSMSGHWVGHNLSKDHVLAVASACVKVHQTYAPHLMEELQGIADATRLSMAELVIVNGFTDFVDAIYHHEPPKQTTTPITQASDNCTAFIVPNSKTKEGYGFLGQTWDMHKTATPFVRLLHCKPTNGVACFVFTITGCIGMIGLNEAGIAVGINNLMGGDGQVGVTWPFVIRKILAQTKINDALACITQAKLAGAHNYLLFDSHGQGYNVEAMSTHHHITQLTTNCLVHTNHCLRPETKILERKRPLDSLQSSENRLSQADELLQANSITLETLFELTREPQDICVRAKPPFYLETCGAAIMRPATREFWAVSGLPIENEYERFEL